MTRVLFAASAILVLVATSATAAEPKATVAGDNPDLAVSTRVTPVAITTPVDADGNLRVVEQSTQPKQVEVVNLPAVQPVNGGVSVTNFPVDNAGNVRVSIQNPAPQTEIIELLSEPIVVSPDLPNDWAYTGTFDATGAKIVGATIHAQGSVSDVCVVNGYLQWRWSPSDDFFIHSPSDARNPGCASYNPGYIQFVLRPDGTTDAMPTFAQPQGTQGRVAVTRNLGIHCSLTIDSVRVQVMR